MKLLSLTFLLFCPLLAQAQLAATVSPVKITGQKAIVPLAMRNIAKDPVCRVALGIDYQ